jgi:uncharacterized protein
MPRRRASRTRPADSRRAASALRLSRFDLLTRGRGPRGRLLLNALAGSADALDPREARAWKRALAAGDPAALGDPRLLHRRGYLVTATESATALLRAVADWRKRAAAEAVQLVLVPTYACDLACSYCLQRHLRSGQADRPAPGFIREDVLAAFFRFAGRRFAPRPGQDPPYVTLYGGEPLLDHPEAERVLRSVLRRCRRRGWGVAVVTHGAHVERYVDLLADGGVREVQVTLDGPREVHDRRRPRRSARDGSTGTFDRIVQGVDGLIARGVPVNLRVVVDRDNFDSLPALARFADRKGWLELPPERFKTQVARNYELYACDAAPDRILDRVELWSRFVALARRNPVLARFHHPHLAGMRILAETGALPPPLLDACPATKREWAFDLSGGIWGCTATVGRADLRLGTFHPRVRLDRPRIEEWSGRDVLSIPECRGCAAAPLCGGGCGAVALERTGRVRAPECRPIPALCGLGAEFYGLLGS